MELSHLKRGGGGGGGDFDDVDYDDDGIVICVLTEWVCSSLYFLSYYFHH